MSSLQSYQVNAFTLPEAWRQCLDLVLDVGYRYANQRGSFETKERKEIDHVTINVKNPGLRPIVPDIPMNLQNAVPPPTDMPYVERYMDKIFTPHKTEKEEYTYGERLSGYKYYANPFMPAITIKQIDEVVEMLKKTPETNQACMEVGTPSDILLKDPPCLRLVDVRARYGALHFIVYFRSWDLWSGFPANLGGLQLLKEYMAGKCGLVDGTMIASSKGMHLYDYSWKYAEIITGRRKLDD